MLATFALRSLTLLVAITLTACVTVGPEYTPPELDVPAEWNGLDRSVNPATHAATADDLSQWWRVFDDPLLSELVEEALRAGPDLRAARAGLREARARRGVAEAERLPNVTASGTASRAEAGDEAGGATSKLYSAGFDASWEVDVFGGVRRGIEAAEADLEASQASLRAVRVSLGAEVALNYIEARALRIRLGIARDNLASQSETLRLTEWRVQAGLASSQDSEQARGNMEQTRAQIPVLVANLAEAEHRLDILLGRPPGTLHPRLAEAGVLPALPDQMAVGIPADTLRQRPDVLAAERTLAAQTARVGAAEAARYPSFKLSGSIGLEALTWSGIGNSGASTWSLLAGITTPIFDAGSLRGQVEIQDAMREQALVEYEITVLSALQDVENALVAIVSNQERGEALSNASSAVRTAALLARHRYSAGLIDFQSVLETERTVLSVADSLASTQADSVLALIRLYKALGGGWSPRGGDLRSGKENS